MSSLRDSTELQQEGGYNTQALVVSAKLPKRPLFRSARLALLLATLSIPGGFSKSYKSKQSLNSKQDQALGLSKRASPNRSAQGFFFKTHKKIKNLQKRLEIKLLSETPKTMTELNLWIFKTKYLQICGFRISDKLKDKGRKHIKEISYAVIKDVTADKKAGKIHRALAGLCNHARQIYSIYGASHHVFKEALTRELDRAEGYLARTPGSEILSTLKQDQKYRLRVREVNNIASTWIDNLLKAAPGLRFLYEDLRPDPEAHWKPLARLIKENSNFYVDNGQYFYRQRGSINCDWQLKFYNPGFLNTDYVVLVNSKNPEEYRNVTLELFYSFLVKETLDSVLERVHQEYLSQKSPKDQELLSSVNFPNKGKIVVLRIYPEEDEETTNKTITQGMFVGRALQEKYGDRVCLDSLLISNHPLTILEKKIKFYKDLYTDKEGGVHFFIDLYAHGHNGNSEGLNGIYYAKPLKVLSIIKSIKKEAKGSFVFFSTLACYGGGGLAELKEAFSKDPDLAKGIVVSTQAKATEYNYIIQGRHSDELKGLCFSEFSEEFIIELLEGKTIGEATKKADDKVREGSRCDADTLIEGKHIGDAGQKNDRLRKIINNNSDPKAV